MEPEHIEEVCVKAGKMANDAIELARGHHSNWGSAITKMGKALSQLEHVVFSDNVPEKSRLAFKYYQVEKYHMETYRYLKQERLFMAYRAADDGLRMLNEILEPMNTLCGDSYAARRANLILYPNLMRRRAEAFYHLESKRISRYTDLINKIDMAEYSLSHALKNEQYPRIKPLKRRIRKLNKELKKLVRKNGA